MSQDSTITQLIEQRDALAKVVFAIWGVARENFETRAEDVQEWMLTAGLVEERPATEEEAERYDIYPGDPLLRLSVLGRVAMSSVIWDELKS